MRPVTEQEQTDIEQALSLAMEHSPKLAVFPIKPADMRVISFDAHGNFYLPVGNNQTFSWENGEMKMAFHGQDRSRLYARFPKVRTYRHFSNKWRCD